MDSVFEREYLYKPADVPLTGFKEKPINRLSTLKQTPSVLAIEANHLKRDFPKDTRDIVPLLEYQLWLEAGTNLSVSNSFIIKFSIFSTPLTYEIYRYVYCF